jgi:hypothetical protein
VNRQRTLLPYRLAFEAARQEMLDHASWRYDNDDLCAQIEAVFHHGAPAEEPLRNFLEQAVGVEYGLAGILVDDLAEAATALRLFEREWMFPHGFALVPVNREVAHA